MLTTRPNPRHLLWFLFEPNAGEQVLPTRFFVAISKHLPLNVYRHANRCPNLPGDLVCRCPSVVALAERRLSTEVVIQVAGLVERKKMALLAV